MTPPSPYPAVEFADVLIRADGEGTHNAGRRRTYSGDLFEFVKLMRMLGPKQTQTLFVLVLGAQERDGCYVTTMDVPTIAEYMGCGKGMIRHYTDGLHAAGYIQKVQEGGRRPGGAHYNMNIYTLTGLVDIRSDPSLSTLPLTAPSPEEIRALTARNISPHSLRNQKLTSHECDVSAGQERNQKLRSQEPIDHVLTHDVLPTYMEDTVFDSLRLLHELTQLGYGGAKRTVAECDNPLLLTRQIRYVRQYEHVIANPGAYLRRLVEAGALPTNPPKGSVGTAAGAGGSIAPVDPNSSEQPENDDIDVDAALHALPEPDRVRLLADCDAFMDALPDAFSTPRRAAAARRAWLADALSAAAQAQSANPCDIDFAALTGTIPDADPTADPSDVLRHGPTGIDPSHVRPPSPGHAQRKGTA